MKKGDKLIVTKDGKYYEITAQAQQKPQKRKSNQSTAYKVLDVMEKVAFVLSTANRAAKRYRKIKQISESATLKSAPKASKLKNVKRKI